MLFFLSSPCSRLLTILLLFVTWHDPCEAKSWANIAAQKPTNLLTADKTDDSSTKSNSYSSTVKKQSHEPLSRPTSPVSSLSKKTLAGVHKTLPAGAERYRVRNVYDGDTLTLVDERRVRFLGIDTPELAEKQPFAVEAKKYTKDLCHKKDVWISYEPGQAKEDHYGRLLAFVWVQAADGSGFLNVNEGIVAAGLAAVYLPRKDCKLHNIKTMLGLQKQARMAHRGIWSTFKDYNVLATPNGAAFHVAGCQHLSKSRHRNLKTLKASVAADKGMHPCRTCLADA